ncbi:MAG: hypothetical protein K0A90_03570 [Methanosarcinaceae archaeon]|nr:hypothetical protein [Methanosarcinaceae archaeon]
MQIHPKVTANELSEKLGINPRNTTQAPISTSHPKTAERIEKRLQPPNLKAGRSRSRRAIGGR